MAIGNILKALIGPILEPLIARIPDPNERARAREAAESQMLAGLMAIIQGQLEVNKEEAKHTSVFVAGWRPFVGWVCGVALAWTFIVYPLTQWAAFLYGVNLDGMPRLDFSELMTVLLGMLGLGGMRTYEKRIGVARSTLGKSLDLEKE